MSELPDLAARVAGWSRDGEDVEVYVSRGTETEVAVYEGEVESLSSATSAGAGIRVVSGGRQGFAYAGSLDETVLAETLEEARSNASFASPEAVGGAPGAGRRAARLRSTSGATSWPHGRPSARWTPPSSSSGRCVRGDPRIRQVESARWGDSSSEMALASSLGVPASDRSTSCYLAAVAVAGEGLKAKWRTATPSAGARPNSSLRRPPTMPSPVPCRHAGGDQAPLCAPPGGLRTPCQRPAAGPARFGPER